MAVTSTETRALEPMSSMDVVYLPAFILYSKLLVNNNDMVAKCKSTKKQVIMISKPTSPQGRAT